MTDALDTFDVVVTGFDPDGEPPASRLQRVFGLAGPAAERLLSRLPAPVQRGVPRVRAEYFRRALLKIGAHVEVRDGQGAVVEILPTVPPPAPLRPSQRPSYVAPPPRAGEPPVAGQPAAAGLLAPAPPEGGGYVAVREDDDLPLAASLRPELLQPAAAPLTLESVPPPAALGAGATADTLIDSRQRPSATGPAVQPIWANAATALPGPAPSKPELPRDTLADAAVRRPANATLTDGVAVAAAALRAPVADASPWGSLSSPSGPVVAKANRAGATVVQGAAVMSQAASAVAAPASSLAQPGFKPPPLELGLDSADMMSKLPSSIWDAPPAAQASAAPVAATPPKPSGGTLLDLPGASAASLDLTGVARSTASIDAPLDLPSIAPAKGRAPLAVARPQAPAQAAREPPPAAIGSIASDAPEAGPRTRKKSIKGKGGKRAPADAGERAPIDFWAGLSSALALPFTGTGGSWIGIIALWGLLASAVTAGSMIFAPLGVFVALCTFTILLALCCDYFRACFWLADTQTRVLERSPALDPARVLHNYLKSGAQLTVFALVTGLPLIFVTIAGIAEGATPLDLFASPSTWFLGFLSALMWPGAVAMSALHNRFEAIWQLPRAIALLAKAPGEYLAIVVIGGLIFGAGVWILLALASAAGVSGALLSATLALPMALGHGVQGVLMGNLMQARPELFR